VRDNAALDAHFLASVREHGVLQPITAVRTEAGIEVRDGQRRTLAARKAKLETIPVYVLDGQVTDDKAATAERIAQQKAFADSSTGSAPSTPTSRICRASIGESLKNTCSGCRPISARTPASP
jgi:hypothetical protein